MKTIAIRVPKFSVGDKFKAQSEIIQIKKIISKKEKIVIGNEEVDKVFYYDMEVVEGYRNNTPPPIRCLLLENFVENGYIEKIS